jgi:hypothetical protein
LARIYLKLEGRRVGNLQILRRAGTHPTRRTRLWLCLCDCGRKKLYETSALKYVKSCGCLNRTRHGDLTGQRIGQLLVVRDSGRRHKQSGAKLWECKCDCGKTKLIETSCLKRKRGSLSCGCVFLARSAQLNRSHGARSLGAPPGVRRAYSSWSNMCTRCTNSNFKNWDCYGGAGVTVCKRWLGPNGFRAFLADMGQRPEGTTLDRRNAFEGYNPKNCRWANREVQALNQRRFYIDGRPPEVLMRTVAEMEAEGW